MTSKTNPENTQEKTENTTKKTTDNKALFGPLGKYAIIAVIMVSVIVTTAIMLDKQLNTAERDLAVIEKEVSELNTVVADTTAKQDEEAVATTVIVEQNTIVSKVVVVETTKEANAKETNNEQSSSEQENIVATAETEQATPAALSTEINTDPVTEVTESTTKEVVAEEDASADVRRAQRKQDNQARLEANKAEQKQRMSELYARINKLEQQQLTQYKSNQDKRVVRLRQQNSHQQEFIDELILRNNELLMMREASMQKNQANREQVLNRI
jgi:hypothetical protein